MAQLNAQSRLVSLCFLCRLNEVLIIQREIFCSRMNSHDDTETTGSYLSPCSQEPSTPILRVSQAQFSPASSRWWWRLSVSSSKVEIWTSSQRMLVTWRTVLPGPFFVMLSNVQKFVLRTSTPQKDVCPIFLMRLSVRSPPCTPGPILPQADSMARYVPRPVSEYASGIPTYHTCKTSLSISPLGRASRYHIGRRLTKTSR